MKLNSRLVFLSCLLCLSISLSGCSGTADELPDSSNHANAISQSPATSDQDSSKSTIDLTLSGKSYTFRIESDESNKKFIKAALTDQGVVWGPAPKMAPAESELDQIPVEPFSMYLNSKAKGVIDKDNSILLVTLPLKENDAFVFLGNIYGNKNHVLYTTYVKKAGMNQAIYNQLFILDLTTNKSVEITQFKEGGGEFFNFGINSDTDDVVYIQSSPSGDTISGKGSVYHLKTDEVEALSTFEISNHKITYSLPHDSHPSSIDDLNS